eukprot:6209440-Pleurochrysis_carterae.AAC.2
MTSAAYFPCPPSRCNPPSCPNGKAFLPACSTSDIRTDWDQCLIYVMAQFDSGMRLWSAKRSSASPRAKSAIFVDC